MTSVLRKSAATRGSNALAIGRLVRDALRNIDDPIALADSPLATLPAIAHLTETKFRGRTCADGIALRALLRLTLQQISEDLEGTVVGHLAAGLQNGRSQAAIANELGMSEEWLCRRFKPQLVELVRATIHQRPSSVQAA